MKVGIPRAFFYHIYSNMMLTFFEKLGVEVVLSPKTNQGILKDGISLSIDESCLAAKIFMGHVKWLVGKCDLIFIPRIESFGKCENACAKFFAMYDIARTTIDAKFVNININAPFGFTEEKAYIGLGKELGFSKKDSKAAYIYAKQVQKKCEEEREAAINEQLKSDKIKVVVVAHAYNTHDEYIGIPIIRALKKQGAEVILASDLCSQKYKDGHKRFAETFTWMYNKELLGVVAYLLDKVDGIVLISSFPCGPDSMTNELLRLEQREVPMICLTADELQGQAGIETRIESFIDILNFQKYGGVN